ncbi:hypothetical protein DFQ26_008965 [Actinomortierella ambigua]|nr:hypothetical protein DFQ26_008965 [Actinomortierella ambigua]
MRILPLEVLDLIIEHVDNQHDLFTLLTISRAIGEKAARELYRDPLRFALPDDSSLSSLLSLLLSLSPADDNQTRILRLATGTPLCSELVSPPMLDYLSFLRVFDWGSIDPKNVQMRLHWYLYKVRRLLDEGDEMVQGLLHHPHFLNRAITFALVGHQLHRIEMLEIEVGDIRRYTLAAAQLSRIVKIRVRGCEPWDLFYSGVKALILAIQLHHGKEQLRDVTLIPNPLEDGPRADATDFDITAALEIYSLLPKPRHPVLLPSPCGSVVALDRPFDRDLARIVEGFVTPWSPTWKAARLLYRDLYPGQLLQRFRSLQNLTVALYPGDDPDIFLWLAYEACQRKMSLQKLTLALKSLDPLWCMRPIEDAMRGFAHSLSELQLALRTLPATPPCILQAPTCLACLDTLDLSTSGALSFHTSFWDNCPKLRHLSIRVSCSQALEPTTQDSTLSFSSPSPSPSPMPSASASASASLPPTTTPTMMVQSRSISMLQLHQDAIHFFDPRSLNHMPSLERLEILCSAIDAAACGTRHTTLWTWDWTVPSLRRLDVEGDLSALGFSFKILGSCPVLKVISLKAICADVHVLNVKGSHAELDNIDRAKFTNLETIEIGGRCTIERDELSYLLTTFRDLKELKVHAPAILDDRVSDSEVVRLVRCHRSLKLFSSPLCLKAPPRDLGLKPPPPWIYLEKRWQDVWQDIRVFFGKNAFSLPRVAETP